MTRYLYFISFPLQTLQGTLLRMKERYLNIPVCPGEKSRSAAVRASVHFGKGKWAALRLQLWDEDRCQVCRGEDSYTSRAKLPAISKPPIPAELGFGICGFSFKKNQLLTRHKSALLFVLGDMETLSSP